MYHLSRTTLAAAAISLGSLSAAFAADLGPRPAYKAMPIATVYDWTGLYIGAHAGWAGADRSFERTFVGNGVVSLVVNPGFSQHPNGFAGGGQIGFNRQTGNWVWGLEAELTGTTLRSSTTVAVPTLPLLTQTYDVNDRLDREPDRAPRLCVGPLDALRQGRRRGDARDLCPDGPGLVIPDSPYLDAKVARLGWTVGAGIENAFLDNWSWKAEYNYMRFDGNDSITNALLRINKSRAVNVPYRCEPSPRQGRHQLQVWRPRCRCRLSGHQLALQSPDRDALMTGQDCTSVGTPAGQAPSGIPRHLFCVVGNIVTPPFTQNANRLRGRRAGRLQSAGRQLGRRDWRPTFQARALAQALPSSIQPGPSLQTYDVEIDWTATLAGRVGYAWDRWMLYGKGGGALMRETYALTAPLLGDPQRRPCDPGRLDRRRRHRERLPRQLVVESGVQLS